MMRILPLVVQFATVLHAWVAESDPWPMVEFALRRVIDCVRTVEPRFRARFYETPDERGLDYLDRLG